MIKQVRIQNYKCLADVTLNLQPFNVLIGPNDAGKTSILEALATVGHLGTNAVKEAFGGVGQPGDVVRHDADPPHICFQTAIVQNGRDCDFGIGVSAGGEVTHEFLRGVTDDLDYHTEAVQDGVIVKMPMADSGHPRSRSYLSVLLQGSRHPDVLRDIAAELHVVQYALNAQTIAKPTSPANDPSAPELAHSGQGLASVLDYMLLVEREHFDTLQRRLCELVPYVNGLWLRPVGGKREVGFLIGQENDRIPASLASDGLLLFLGYLVLLYMPGDRPGTILVDEPENGIHPLRLRQAVELLRQLCRDKSVQIVLATHSPYLLDWVEPQEVQILTRGDDLATQATCMADVPDIDLLRKGYQLGELWFNYGEEELIKGVK